LPIAAWPAALVDERQALHIGPHYGRQVRTDCWRAQAAVYGWEVVYLVEAGRCVADCGGERAVLEPGTLFWWPAGRPLTIAWPVRFVFSELWFRLDGLRLSGPLPVAQRAWEAAPWLAAASDLVAMGAIDHEARLRHLLALVLLEFQRPHPAGGLDAVARQAVADCMTYHLEQRLERGLGVAELARAAGRAPAPFTRAFTASYGLSPRAWIVRERMRHAGRLLREGGLGVAEVAARLGYAEPSPFSRQFRRVLGVSPERWRHR
jgi:AraC family transcriptional regulator